MRTKFGFVVMATVLLAGCGKELTEADCSLMLKAAENHENKEHYLPRVKEYCDCCVFEKIDKDARARALESAAKGDLSATTMALESACHSACAPN